MSAVIFCGPSVPEPVRARYPHFVFLPPVRQGELFQAVQKRPRAVGIIDGFFDGVPAVLHKEILWAMNEGAEVFGAASMGALRAAELHTFGMRGVGSIFEAYRDGQLTDDDEVALLHGPAETGYMPLSEPMVNIRATAAAAVSENVLAQPEADLIPDVAKGQFYQERTWRSVLSEAEAVLSADAHERFAAWLPDNMVDQKSMDAELLLETVAEYIETGQGGHSVSYAFQWTEAWDALVSRSMASGENDILDEEEAVLDELRLLADRFSRVREKALCRLLAVEELRRSGRAPEKTEMRQSETAFRASHDLFRQADLRDWAESNHVDAEHFGRMMEEDAGVSMLGRERSADLKKRILYQLRLDGSYGELRERALEKVRLNERRALRQVPVPPRSLLFAWYFETRHDMDIPADLERYAEGLGLKSLRQFEDLLAKEYALGESQAADNPSGADKDGTGVLTSIR